MEISVSENTVSHIFDATVLIIDPCYVVSSRAGFYDEWLEICDNIDNAGTVVIDCIPFLYVRTFYGDGQYAVFHNGKFVEAAYSDAGLLSVWTLQNALAINPTLDVSLGAVIEHVSGSVYVDGKTGSIFGSVSCDTSYEDIEEF